MTAPATFSLPDRLSYRSMPALVMGSVLSVLLVVAGVGMWVAMGPEARAQWSAPQLYTILLFLVILVGVIMSVGLSKVSVDAEGVTIRNMVRTRHYAWAEVEDFTMASGDPWVYLKLVDTVDADGDSRPVLAVQRAEGDTSEERLEMLRLMARRFKRT